MYFVGAVQCQNLLSTLQQLITSPSPTTGQPYWQYIGTTSTDGAYQSTDGNNVIIRIANAGVGLSLAMGTYESYTPGSSQGIPGTFGRGDYQLIFYYAGNCGIDGYAGSAWNGTWLYTSYYPFISDVQNNQPIPSIAGKISGGGYLYQSGEYTPGFQYTPSTASGWAFGNSTVPYIQNQNLVALPPTATVYYWLVVTKQQVTLILQGDPGNPGSLRQIGSVGLLNKWNNEPGNYTSYILATQWKMYGNDPSKSDQGSWGIEVLRDKSGNWNHFYSTYIPNYTNLNSPQNVWLNTYQLSPISLYESNEGYRGSLPGLAFMNSRGITPGDEFQVIDSKGIAQTWKYFTFQINNLYFNQPMLPSLSMAILLDQS